MRSTGVYNLFIKRLLDLILSGILLGALAPLLVVLALFVRVLIGSPVLFRQMRPGRAGKPFTLYKFRTMRDAFDRADEPLPDAERLVPLGRFLRKTSLDELPELWNVLKGEMSLVGPRPLLLEYLPLYNFEQARRHDVRPGITGLAQVSGRNALTWSEKFALDVWYVDHVSLRLDISIVARTVSAVIGRKGISAPSHETMPKFTGNDC